MCGGFVVIWEEGSGKIFDHGIINCKVVVLSVDSCDVLEQLGSGVCGHLM